MFCEGNYLKTYFDFKVHVIGVSNDGSRLYIVGYDEDAVRLIYLISYE